MQYSRQIRRYWILVVTVLISAVLHAVGVVAMLAAIQPGLDFAASFEQRAQYVADHAWLWRLAWLPWQLTAASDLAVSAALTWWLWGLRKESAALSLAFWAAAVSVPLTIAAIIPEQTAEYYLVTGYPALAEHAAKAGPASSGMISYAAAERSALIMTGLCGNTGYTCMALMWLAATFLAVPATWRRVLFAVVGIVSSVGFAGASVVLWTSVQNVGEAGVYPNAELLVVCNGIGFGLLIPWMAWMAAMLGDGHHQRRISTDAALHTLRWPVKSLARWIPVPGPGARDVARCASRVLPVPVLASDITDVVYLNWLVPASRVQALLPPPLKLHCFGELTFVTVLTYQHHHFGPLLAGPLRRLCPSPTQSNWRFYLEPETGSAPRDGIYFFASCLAHPLLTIASRLMSDGLPAHYPAQLLHNVDDGRYETSIVSGGGSSPSLHAIVETDSDQRNSRQLPAALAEHFASWEEAARYLVEQNRAVGVIPAHGGVYESKIQIPIDVATILPAKVVSPVVSQLLQPMIEDTEAFAFVVPQVPFRATGERWTKWL